MEERQIIKNLQALKAIKPANDWKNGLKSELFGAEPPQENVFSRGFLPSFNFKLAPVAVILAAIVLVSGCLLFIQGKSPEVVQETQSPKPESYLVLIETKLDDIKSSEDIAEVTDMMKKAEKEIEKSADNLKETAITAQKVADISKKVDELEEQLGENAKDLADSADILASKTAEVLEQGIENTSQQIRTMVSNLIAEYEAKSLSNPQKDLLQQAKEYYNNQQFELALETILNIGK